MIVVSDTSPIANLLAIGKLDLLREVYQRVLVPEKVRAELLEWKVLGADITTFEQAGWIEARVATNRSLVEKLSNELDAGEAEALALALELEADYLLIDERRGWRLAKSMGLNAIGLLGVLLNAKRLGVLPEVMPVVEELRTVAGFWIGQDVVDRIRQIAGE